MISANVKLALRCRSTLSEYTKVLRARSGSPEKKSISDRYFKDMSGVFDNPVMDGKNIRSPSIVIARQRLLARSQPERCHSSRPWNVLSVSQYSRRGLSSSVEHPPLQQDEQALPMTGERSEIPR